MKNCARLMPGAAGAGMSTTLYELVLELRSSGIAIVSIEDDISQSVSWEMLPSLADRGSLT